MRQRRVRPAVGIGDRKALPDDPILRGPLGGHLAPGLRLDLNHLRRQRLDGLDDRRAESLHAGGVGFRQGTAGSGAAAYQQDVGLTGLTLH